MMSRFRNLWVRFWMQLAGRGLVGRFATRMATMLGPRFYDRVSLSLMNRGGYVAPKAAIDHAGLLLGANVFIDEGVQIFESGHGSEVDLDDRVHLHRNTRIFTGEGV